MELLREFCAENLTLVPAAVAAGARRIELCDNLAVGGTSPSYGVIKAAVGFARDNNVQVMAMVLPRIIQKRAQKNATKLSANPAQTDQQRQMKMVSIIMVGFTIVMGFMLPAAMGVYWLISGLLSMAQTFITQLIIHRKGGPKKSR